MAGESQQTPAGEPDPTVLTTEQLLREIQSVKDWTKEKVEALRDVSAEQFASVNTQFEISERQRVEQKQDTKAAVDAALTAQKEAVQEQTKASAEAIGKSEVQFSSAQQQLATQFETGLKGLNDKYDDLKDRLVRIETTTLTNANNHDQQRMDYGLLVSIGAVCVSIIAVVVVVLLAGPR